MNLAPQIQKLRLQGKTYLEIASALNCSKGTVAYHLGTGQKEKTQARRRKHRKQCHPFLRKLENFFNPTQHGIRRPSVLSAKQLLKLKIETFCSTGSGANKMYQKPTFTIDDVLKKIGENPTCYLTGQPIDIQQPRTYQFDHIIPRSRGGTNTLDNLALCSTIANQSKRDMTPDEFINLCKLVLQHNGYKLTEKIVFTVPME